MENSIVELCKEDMSLKNANIYQRMSLITTELTAVAKNLTVSVGSSKYKAVGEADVLAAVKPLESKYGVYSYPFSREIVENDVITATKEYNGQKSESAKFFMRLKTVYRFVNIEKPDEYIDITTYGDGIDSGDKAPGKAMTYADKYALLKAYKIITGEDPDQYASEGLKGKNSAQETTWKVTAIQEKALILCGADAGYDEQRTREIIRKKTHKEIKDLFYQEYVDMSKGFEGLKK